MKNKRSRSEPRIWLWDSDRHQQGPARPRRLSGVAWKVGRAEDLAPLARRFPDVISRLDSGEQSPEQAYEELMLSDARHVAECFLPVYRSSHGRDGFAGVEISPELAYDTGSLLDEARRLRAAVPLPNVMIQIPGTHEALPAIRRLAGEGMNLDISRIVSLSGYVQAARACIKGIRDRDVRGESLNAMTCTATIFLDSSELRSAMGKESEDAQSPFLENGGGIPGEIAAKAMKALLSAHENILNSNELADLALKGALPPAPMWIVARDSCLPTAPGRGPGTSCEMAYDLTTTDLERVVAALAHADAASAESAAAERIVELFLHEYSDGESIMDSLQREMIVDEVTRLDRTIKWLERRGRCTVPRLA